MTDAMRWTIVLAGSFIAVLFTITAMVLLIPGGGPSPSCIKHGGVVSTHEAHSTSTVYFVCRDGKIVERP